MKIDDEYIRNATENAKRLRCIWEKTRLDQEEQFQRNQSLARSEARKKKILSTFENLVCIAITCFVLVFGVKHFFLDDGQKQDSVAQNTSGVETSVNKEETNNIDASLQSKNKEDTNNDEIEKSKELEEDENNNKPKNIQMTEQALREFGLFPEEFSIIGTSYGHSKDGFIIADAPRGRSASFYVFDNKNNRVAYFEATKSLATLFGSSKKQMKPLIIYFNVLKDIRDKDENIGEWNGKSHRFSVNVEYEENADGSIDLGMLTSGKGAHAYRFDMYLEEQKNVDLVELTVNEAQALLDDLNKNGFTNVDV